MRMTNWMINSSCNSCLLLMTVFCIGCGGTQPVPTVGDKRAEHGHPTEGPHGGELIELGNEEYHAELVHDEQANTITIYLLDSAAKNPVAIDAADVTVNLKHDGKGEQFTLSASPDQGDLAGQSSRFVSSDRELAEDLDHEGADAQLVVTIKGKPYRAKIPHDHDGREEGEHSH